MIWLMFFCSLCFADDVVTLKKGEKAPFSGTLLSPGASARLLAKKEKSLDICLAEKEKEKALLQAEADLKFKSKEAELASCLYTHKNQVAVYEKQIQFLEKRTNPPIWKNTAIFASGILTGVGIISVSAWTLNKIK